MRVRGLKFLPHRFYCRCQSVAPRAGAWIEILTGGGGAATQIVAPRAGAWIEILLYLFNALRMDVAPRAGAWIEIY